MSVKITDNLKQYKEVMVAFSQIQTKLISKPCGENVELLIDKLLVHIVTTGLPACCNSATVATCRELWKFFMLWLAFGFDATELVRNDMCTAVGENCGR
jgi:hypothetical protein